MNYPVVRVLSLDGGGILGIVMLHILNHIEQVTGRSIASFFHVISGVSAGGLITLGLTVPKNNGDTPRYSASCLLKFYHLHGQDIFSNHRNSIMDNFLLRSISSLFYPRYGNDSAHHLYKNIFGDTLISQALRAVVIPSYAIDLRNIDPILMKGQFKSTGLKNFHSMPRWGLNGTSLSLEKKPSYYMHDVAMATSAAPTYFSPHKLLKVMPDQTVKKNPHLFIDGGVAINNPAILAYRYAKKLYPDRPISLLSLGFHTPPCAFSGISEQGAGLIKWGQCIKDLIVLPQLSVYDWLMKQECQDTKRFFLLRIAPEPGISFSAMDDVSARHRAYLEKIGHQLLKKWENVLDDFLKTMYCSEA